MPPNPGISPSRKFGKAKARHFVGDDQVADEREFKAAAEGNAVNCGDGSQRCRVQRIHHAMDAFEEIVHSSETVGRAKRLGHAM